MDALSATYLDALEAEMLERWVDGKGIADGNRILDLIRRVRVAELERESCRLAVNKSHEQFMHLQAEHDDWRIRFAALRELLKKYIEHVVNQEGVNFLRDNERNPRLFTEGEWVELQALDKEAERDYPLSWSSESKNGDPPEGGSA